MCVCVFFVFSHGGISIFTFKTRKRLGKKTKPNRETGKIKPLKNTKVGNLQIPFSRAVIRFEKGLSFPTEEQRNTNERPMTQCQNR